MDATDAFQNHHHHQQEDDGQLEPTCYWWSWGAGTHGQLATGAFRDELLPCPLHALSDDFLVRRIACGGSHAAAALRSGEVMTWGNGSSGQLGHGNLDNLPEPKAVNYFQSTKIKIVSAGWSHTAFISEEQVLFTCGSGGFGQLGHGNFESCSSPEIVTSLSGMDVIDVACGMRHTLILIGSGKSATVYGFGSSKRGQLGLSMSDGSRHRFCDPQKVVSLNDCRISSVYANGDQSAALSNTGEIYIWGRGFGARDYNFVPFKISTQARFCQLALGWNHLLALSSDGMIYYIQGKSRGLIEHKIPGSSSNQQSEILIHPFDPLKGISVRRVAAGSEHSAVVLDNGSVLIWGWGEHGQLGLGTTNDESVPQVVSSIPKSTNSEIFCGCGFTFCMSG